MSQRKALSSPSSGEFLSSDDDVLRLGLTHHRAGEYTQAAASYARVLSSDPGHFGALYLSGMLAHQTGDHARSVQLLRRALIVSPGDADCLNVLALALAAIGQHNEAEACFHEALASDPSAEVFNNLAIVLKKQGRLEEAVAAFKSALRLDATCEDGVGALGQTLLAMNKSKEAVPYLQRAVELTPDDPALRCDLADALSASGQGGEAEAEYRQALAVDPHLHRAWYSLGCSQSASKNYADAVLSFRKALILHPEWHEAQHNLAQALFRLGHVDDALLLFRQAAARPYPELPSAMIAVIIPGCAAATNEEILEARRAWAGRLPVVSRAQCVGACAHRPLRVGYVSSFFARDNWMKPVWALINAHDRERFELHLFSDAPASAIKHAYKADERDHFHDTTGLSNDAVCALIRQCGIDLLIDLNGYSNMRRLPLFASRPAPVIAGWFNMFATTGMSCYDYLIGDSEVIPPEEEVFYAEKIVRVPGSYLTFQVGYPVPDVTPLPCLVNGRFTFGCLAPLYKITPDVIAALCRILKGAPRSSLILKNSALGIVSNAKYVTARFEEHGIAPERICLEGPAGHYEFLQTYADIDLALDTFPYDGGTTTTEALWQGVPVVTFWGDRWVSRTSASILRAANLPDFVCRDVEAYIQLATSFATTSEGANSLSTLRQNMRARLLNSPVCDAVAFARNMEQIYLSIHSVAMSDS